MKLTINSALIKKGLINIEKNSRGSKSTKTVMKALEGKGIGKSYLHIMLKICEDSTDKL